MTLIRTSLLTGVASLVKLLTLLGINKVLAIYVGPAGYAALGQFQNAVQMFSIFASGAVNTGVTKYTAEYHSDSKRQHVVWQTASMISIFGSLVTSAFIFLFNKWLAGYFLKDENLGSVFIWFSFALLLLVMNALFLAILNGKKEIKLYVSANILGSLISLIITGIMVVKFGLYGALIALAIYQSLTFFATFFLIYKTSWFQFGYFFGKVEFGTVKNLMKYTLMALTSAVCIPLSHILIRNHLGENLGWDVAGYWEAMWRLSKAYLMLITTTLGVYYLPKLSELTSYVEIKKEVIRGFKVILPVAILCSALVYGFRNMIISILFSPEFATMHELFALQMIGDTLKISSWILAYLMLAKTMVKLFIVSEILSSLGFFCLTYLFTDTMGMQAPVMAHAINYFVYFILMLVFIGKSLKAADNTSV